MLKNEIEIAAITCVNGNTMVSNVYTNVQRILKLCNTEHIPVYIGASEPLIIPENKFECYYHGKDGLGDLQYENDNLTVKNNDYNRMKLSQCKSVNDSDKINSNNVHVPNRFSDNAIVALNKIVSENAGDITLICLGPLTNIALAMKVYSQFASNIQEIYIMGGNHKGVGNVTSAAEFNFHIDPEAAYIVLHYSKCPITILPWEPCMDSTITLDWRFNTLGKVNHPTMNLLNAAEKRIYEDMEKFWWPCDAFLVAAFLFPDVAKTSLNCHASVELHGNRTRAQMVINHTKELKPNVAVITELNLDLFKSILLQTFNHK
ncbi:uncharacterized protein CBL_06291 [Carabus blaptoides fortunei]